MKQRSMLFFALRLALCLVLCAVIAAGGSRAFAADTKFNLRITHPMSTASYTHKAVTAWAEYCREESGGTIDFTIYPADTLVTSAELYDAVLAGNVDIGQMQVSYSSNVMPELIPMEIPGLYSGSKYPALHPATQEVLTEIFAKYGVKYLCPLAHDVLVYVGDSLVTDPAAQLPGKRIRVSGKWIGESVAQWGGSPMTIPVGDVSTALERKTINLVTTSWIATAGFKFYEMGPNVTFTDMNEVFPGFIMNEDLYQNQFSDSQRQAFDRATQRFIDLCYDLMIEEKNAFIQLCKDEGVAMHVATDAENQFYRKAALALLEKVRAENNIGELGEKLITAVTGPELQ